LEDNKIIVKSVKAAYEDQQYGYEDIAKEFGKEKLTKILINMVKTRYVDQEIDQLIKEGTPITQHSTYGQEGSQVVAASILEQEDYIVPNHRGWGWAIGKGLDLKKFFAEIMYKETGYCKGKGGPHLASKEHNLFLRVGIQGSYAGLAAGIGLSIQMRDTKDVCMCIFGDGSSNAGYIHEGMNIASANKLPILFFCENNQYALFTHCEKTTAVKDLGLRAIGYGMPGYIVDGMDAFAVMKVFSDSVHMARSGKGPILIETKTYRFSGHTEHDRFCYGGYRSKKEVDEWKKRDPIKFYIEKIKELHVLTEKEIIDIQDNIKLEIKEAVEYARSSKLPNRENFVTGAYLDL
jgi:TPP-dependent pyruvate/acetoin dehydrogenase alpha subunit